MKKENHFLGLKESLFFFFLFQKILHMLQRKMKDFRILCCTAAACMRAHIRTFPRMFPRQAKLKSPQVMFLMFFFTFYFGKEMSSSKPFWTVGWKWICTQFSFSCILYSTRASKARAPPPEGGSPLVFHEKIFTSFCYDISKIDQYFIFKYYNSNVTKILQI